MGYFIFWLYIHNDNDNDNDKLLLRIISSTFKFFNVDPYKQRSVKVIWYTYILWGCTDRKWNGPLIVIFISYTEKVEKHWPGSYTLALQKKLNQKCTDAYGHNPELRDTVKPQEKT